MHQEARTGSAVISAMLRRLGIRTVFSLAGAAHYRLLDQLDQDGCAIITSRHEAATVLAADGYSRVTGRPGVAVIIAPQGIVNAVPGILGAWEACSPVLTLVVRQPLSQSEPEQPVDQDELLFARGITRWARTVHHVDRLGEYLDAAVRHATLGRQGPVVLAIPSDLLAARTDLPLPAQTACALPAVSQDDLGPLLERLSRARRPMIIAGGGAFRARAQEGLARLAALGIPILTHGLGRGTVQEDLQTGFPWALAQVAAPLADLVVVAGARITQRFGYGRAPRFAAEAPFFEINLDPGAIGRNRPATGLVADAGLATRALADVLEASGARWDPGWVREAMAARLARIDEVGRDDGGPIHPFQLLRPLQERLPATAIVCSDGADINNWASAILRLGPGNVFMDHYPSGMMGMVLPLAVGAAAAAREQAGEEQPRETVLVTGDGSFGFYPMELHGAAQAGLRLKVIVSNDQA